LFFEKLFYLLPFRTFLLALINIIGNMANNFLNGIATQIATCKVNSSYPHAKKTSVLDFFKYKVVKMINPLKTLIYLCKTPE